MGLSVISQLATVISATPAAGSIAAGDALPGDFAALLAGQALPALMSLGGDAAIIPKTLADDTAKQDPATGDTAADTGVSVLDPAALIAMLGNAQGQPVTRSEPPKTEANDETLAAAASGQWLPANIPAESKPRDLPVPDKALPAQRATLGTPGTQAATAPHASDPAPASKPALDTANIAAGSEPGTSQAPAFSEAIATSLQQRGVAPGVHSTATATTNTATGSVPAHLHSSAWSQQFSEKVVWMASHDVQSAQININPPQLGPLQITLSLNGDQASAVFASPHAEVRQAIESSMPQLKEMLASAGISLGDTNVGANLAQQNQNSPFSTPNRTQATLENAILPANDNAPGAGVATPLQQGRGLVDLFA